MCIRDRYYSTPGSSTFINGVLDKIVESLTAEGRIRKALSLIHI